MESICKDDTIYIDKIVADKANFSEQWNVNLTDTSMEKNVYDSYGNLHWDALELL